ncbi:MAG: hypothetical protein ACI9W4_001824 [Rhodothermales bacterium]
MLRFVFVFFSATLVGCSGTRPVDIGMVDRQLTNCPETPNCVSSDGDPLDEQHYVAALSASGDPAMVWAAVRAAVEDLPRTTIVRETENYLYAESVSRIFRFVDDIEVHWRPSEGVVAVRSASRIGRKDFGVNRKRIERLRELLQVRLDS